MAGQPLPVDRPAGAPDHETLPFATTLANLLAPRGRSSGIPFASSLRRVGSANLRQRRRFCDNIRPELDARSSSWAVRMIVARRTRSAFVVSRRAQFAGHCSA